MKINFKPVKNIILLIASALTLVAVTFAWYSLSKNVGNFQLDSDVSGSTLSVNYFVSSDGGKNYSKLIGDISMNNVAEGQVEYYRMDVKTFKDKPVKLIMSFEGLTSNNISSHVYFDYTLKRKDTGVVLSEAQKLKMSDYVSNNVFAFDVSSFQSSGVNEYVIDYNVYVVSDGESISGSSSLGEVKITGQQV